ncbi:MAG: right-handed parallel beta-helix repeat-containing protein [Candidatus Pacearchaeota archaeon]|nr:right-handed parallel beta-helix repeat-containing protein [Candidatus Pacearchaeota archaeon]
MRREFFVVALAFALIFFAATVKADICHCNDCSSCNDALNNESCREVLLDSDIVDYGSTCIDNPVNFSNKLFDCRGHKIDGDDSGQYGIYLENKNNNTIRNCVISDFNHGIYLELSLNNNIINNTLNSNSNGVSLERESKNNIVVNNTIENNTNSGILIEDQSNNNLINANRIAFNRHGIASFGAEYNNFTNNFISFSDNHGMDLNSNGHLIANNIVTNSGQWGIYINTGSNYTLLNNTAHSNGLNGFRIGNDWDGGISNSTIMNNLAYNNSENGFLIAGVSSFPSENNSFFNNTARDNGNYGFFIETSHVYNNAFINNTAYNNNNFDIYIESASDNVFINQTLAGSSLSIYPTLVSFSYEGNIFLKGVSSPPNDPSNFTNISKYIEASGTGTLFINFSYSDSDLGGVAENSLRISRNNGTWETNTSVFSNIYGVDTINNKVYANISNFGSVFAPLGIVEFSDICHCNDCSSCNDALNNESCREVLLDDDIIDYGSTCIDNPVNFSNKTFDCRGHKIDGDDSGQYGIYLNGKNNTRIRNCDISNFELGIYLESNNNNNIIENNSVHDNIEAGIYIDGRNNSVRFNKIYENNGKGIEIKDNSYNNKIISNLIYNHADNEEIGIYDEGHYTLTFNNTLFDNYHCIRVKGELDDDYFNISQNNLSNCSYFSIFIENCYYAYIEKNNINNSSGGVYVVDSDHVSIKENVIKNIFFADIAGIYLWGVSNSNVQFNQISSSVNGIYLDGEFYGSYNNNVTKNNLTDVQEAIYCYYAEGQKITQNDIYNSTDGIWFSEGCSSGLIDRNNVVVANKGIYLNDGAGGNNVTNNVLSEVANGIYLSNVIDNYIYRNRVDNFTDYGIVVDQSGFNNIVENNEVSNGQGATGRGIEAMNGAQNNVFVNNFVHNNYIGLSVSSAGNGNNFTKNRAENNDYGMYIHNSSYGIFDNNRLEGNDYGIYVPASFSGFCWGMAASCSSFSNQMACQNQQSCRWSIGPGGGKCIGTPTPCERFINESSCNKQLGCLWLPAYFYSNRWDITNNVVNGDRSNGEYGIFLQLGPKFGSKEHNLFNNSVSGYNIGLFLNRSHSNNISYLKLYNNDVDLVNNALVQNNFNDIIFGSTRTSFNYSGTFNMTSYRPTSAPSGMASIGKGLSIKNSSALELNITFYYEDSDLSGIKSESSLALYELEGTWQKVPGQTLDIGSNTITATLSNFSNFAIFGEEKPSAGGGGGGYVPPVCGDGKCDSRRENYLNCPEDCVAPSEPPKNISKDLGDVGDGKEIEGGRGEAFRFRVKGQGHVAQIDGIKENSIVLFIWSNPLKVDLIVGKDEKLDLDGNNYAELEILLKKIDNGKALLFLKELKEEMPPSVTSEETKPIEEKKKPSLLLPIIIIVIIVILILWFLWQAREKKLRHHGYK